MSAAPHTTPQTSSAAPVSASSTSDLLTWKNPVATAKVFGSIVAALILVKINVLNYVFHLAYLGLLLSAGAEYAGKLIVGEGFVSKYAGSPNRKSETFRQLVLPALASFAECFEAELHKVVYAQDTEATLKAAGVSYILYKLTSWFSLYTLAFVTVILTFTVPFVYQQNKKEIDAAVAQYSKLARAKTSEYTALAHKKVAPHLDNFAKKTGPVGSFIQSKFPTRTAGSTVGSPQAGSAHTTAPLAAEEPSTGVSTGASKFPEVPSAAPTLSVPTLSSATHVFTDGEAAVKTSL